MLANHNQHAVRLICFSEMGTEDFIEFKNRILDYIGVKSVKDETQKLYMLHSKLRILARIKFNSLISYVRPLMELNLTVLLKHWKHYTVEHE